VDRKRAVGDRERQIGVVMDWPDIPPIREATIDLLVVGMGHFMYMAALAISADYPVLLLGKRVFMDLPSAKMEAWFLGQELLHHNCDASKVLGGWHFYKGV
jgi:hypothetical protein